MGPGARKSRSVQEEISAVWSGSCHSAPGHLDPGNQLLVAVVNSPGEMVPTSSMAQWESGFSTQARRILITQQGGELILVVSGVSMTMYP